MNDPVLIEFQKIDSHHDFELALVSLNRPDKANALNEEMISGLNRAFESAKSRKSCRALILRANGKNFCSGADLAWMKKASTLSYEDNILDAEQLGKVFERLSELPFPTLALVQGSSAGGGLGLVACCDVAIAIDDASFSLKEVRVGLLPAMILPYLLGKMERSALLRLGLTAEVFSAREALRTGLVSMVCSESELSGLVRETMQKVLEGAPKAQGEFKLLLRTLNREKSPKMQLSCIEAIAKARAGEEGQKGLAAVLAKTKPYWAQKLSDDWTV
jgi:methylglutaconyl-CoA hydratase